MTQPPTGQPRVLLDATAIPPDRGGVGRYVEELTAALDAAGVPLTVACQHRDARAFGERLAASTVVPVSPRYSSLPARFAWEQTGLPLLARKTNAQVVHSPHYTVPLLSPVPVVVTLHDATFFSHPQLHEKGKGPFFRSWIRLALRRSAVALTVSQATADELTRWAKAKPGKMVVTHLGVDAARFHPPAPDEIDSARKYLGLAGPYVAFLATLEPRKNVPALVRGFVRAVAHLSHPPALVLAGGPGWDTEIEAALGEVPAGLTVLRPGYLPVELLSGYLGGAELVCYPSLGEGFGLPVAEAMSCGAVVLTTGLLSLPEVGGDAVAYCGTSPAEIAAGLTRLLDDPGRRKTLGSAARTRAAGFTWAACAEKTVRAYHRALSA